MQLEAGVRYFDLRIARKRNDHHPTRLYFYHGLYTSTDVEVIISISCKSTRLLSVCICIRSFPAVHRKKKKIFDIKITELLADFFNLRRPLLSFRQDLF